MIKLKDFPTSPDEKFTKKECNKEMNDRSLQPFLL